MKKVLCSMAFLVKVGAVNAQDKLVKKSRALLDESVQIVEMEGCAKKNSFDIHKIEESYAMLQPPLTSGQTKNMAMAGDLQGDIYQRIFAPELDKAAAKEPFDTIKLAENLQA